MSDDNGNASERPQEKKKLYIRDNKGIRFRSDRKVGDVRIPNYVFDLWMPLLGAEAIGVYALYCRLERDEPIRKLTLDDIARSCRIGKKTLLEINNALAEHKFISIKKPKGQDRLKHYTTEFTIHDPPAVVPQKVITEKAHPQGYTPLAVWLVDQIELPEVPDRTSGGTTENPPDVPDRTSTVLKPLSVAGDGIDTDVSIPRTVANAPDAPAVPTPEEDAIDALRAELSATLTEEEKAPTTPAPFAHVAPGGHVWIASADSVQGMTAHLGRNTSDKSRPVCGARMKHRTEHIQLGAQPCAACVAKATAPQKPKKRQPPPDVKTYIAELCYGKGDGLIDASWSSIVNAWNETKFPGLDKLEKFKLWWYAQDFRGKKGDKPKPYQITAEWDTAMAFGLPTGPTEEEMEAEWAAAGKPRAVKRHE